jgi:hypothetical protein
MKLVEMAIVMVFNSVEDEWTFFTLNFVKSKFHNQLITNLNLVVCMCAQQFYYMESFPFYIAICKWTKGKVHYCEQQQLVEKLSD